MRTNEDDAKSQAIAIPHPGYTYVSYESGSYVARLKTKTNCKAEIKRRILHMLCELN